MLLNGNNNKGSNTDVNVANGGIEFVKDHLVPALWMNDSSGDWNTLANWNSGQTPIAPVQGPGQVARVGSLTLPSPRAPGTDDVPRGVEGDDDTVILDRPSGNITVTHSSGVHNIRKLFVKESLNITGGTLSAGYVPSADSTPISAQFSGAVSLTGGAFSVHTLQVDAAQTFTLGGGTLTLNRINLMPGAVPAKIDVTGDVNVSPLSDAAAVIARGAGAGSTGTVDLGGDNRTINVANGSAAVDLSINVPVTNGALTKAGAGVLALSAANTYVGDTSVLAGTLRLGSASLANAADVHLAAGATLELSFAGVDVIESLLIDGVSQPAGVWGAVGSGAEFTSPLLAGTGRLEVTTFVAPTPGDFNGDGTVDGTDLAAWQTHAGMTGEAGTEHGDADADGDVDGSDFLAWQQNVNVEASPAAAAQVPEPAAAALAALAALAAACGRRAR
jgi:autotransporter-associated beta strand protein